MEESKPPTSTGSEVETTTRPQGNNNQRSNSENSNSNFRTTSSHTSSGSSGYGGKANVSQSTAQKDIKTMEDNATTTSITNAIDSAYSQSNGRSQSSESSQMRGCGSSGSSGYGGKQKILSQAQAENSASSGNSAELTTIKNLKRSKNKGRKKKAKTKQSQTQQQTNKTTEPDQEAKPQEATSAKSATPTLEQQTSLATETVKPEEVAADSENKLNRIVESIADKQATETDKLQIESTSDVKPVHDHNAIPLNSTESMKEKAGQHIEEESSATDKSPDDLEVDNILSHSKVEQQTAEHRTNSIQESFCCAVSMHDGVILSTTANLTESLGFPKDVWLGRAFIDFVHPKDRSTFASQITSGYIDHISLKDDYLRQSNFEKTPLYVLLRCYRGFDACGFAVKNRPVSYKPFKLIFRKAPEMPSSSVSAQDGNSALRIICAIALSSIYKVPDEAMKKQSATFSTRHTAAGILVHIDGNSVAAIGFMPQDIIGKSILDFFHPEDMVLLESAYDLLMKNTKVADGRVSTKPYRFFIKNGCYITLETEWTRVFNPWSRKLEFVTGDHSVLKGPNHCDVFTKTAQYAYKFPHEILEQAAKIKEKLLRLLSEPVPYPSDSVKQQVSKRCQALASFLESLLIGVKRQELKLDLLTEEPAASEHGSVMLGEISPHHHDDSNHDDSKSSSETPPTYNQLNYQENLNRFFNSVQPTFVPKEFKSLPYKIDHVPTNEKDRMLSPIQQGGEESSGSQFNSSSDSPRFESPKTSNMSNNSHTIQPHLVLSEASVSRHTDDMELQMVKNHKKNRMRSSYMTDKKKAPDKGVNQVIRNQPVKRSWPHKMKNLNNELSKNSKSQNQNEHRYASNADEKAQADESMAQMKQEKFTNGTNTGHANKVQAVHLWPPFSVNNATTVQNNIPTNSLPNTFNQFLLSNHLTAPRYYTPPNCVMKTDQNVCVDQPPKNVNIQPAVVPSTLSNPFALHYIKNLMGHPRPFLNQNMVYPYPPIAYHPLPMLQQSTASTIQASGAANVSLDMPPTSPLTMRRAPEQVPNMAFYNNANDEPVNLSKNNDETMAKLQVKQWAKLKDENSEMDASNSSFGSSFFDSQQRTDESESSKDDSMGMSMGMSEPNPQAQGALKRGKTPYWMKNVNSTPELVMRYQMKTRDLQDALQADLRVLKEINQPGMVNDQLDQLYLELELENTGYEAKISLGDTPSNSSEDEENMLKKKKNTHYTKLSMIYEENAPVQPPVEMN